MPEVMALSCPVCAAPLSPDNEKCSFCGSFIVIKSDLPKLNRHTLNQAVIQEHIADFRRRVRSNSYDEEAHYGLGIAYFNLGLVDDAIDELTTSARLMPENPHIQSQLAVALRDSYQAGNHAAEPKLRTRIQNALLLDPKNVEANLLKAELLVADRQYQEAIETLDAIKSLDEKRTQPRIVGAAKSLFAVRMATNDWRGLQRSWRYLEPIAPEATKELVLWFLKTQRDQIPRSMKLDGRVAHYTAPISPISPKRSRAKRTLYAFLMAVGGLIIGFIQLAVFGSIAPSYASGSLTFLGGLIILVSFLVFIALPILGAIIGYRRTGKPKPGSRTKPNVPTSTITKDEVLAGMVDLMSTRIVADQVVIKLMRQEKSLPSTSTKR